jgi:hypothetical protein
LAEIDITYWLCVLATVAAFTIGLMIGNFGLGVIPLAIWLVLAYTVERKLYEHVHKTCEAIKRIDSTKSKMDLARKTKMKFNLVSVAVGAGLAVVVLVNYIYRLDIFAKLDADSVFYFELVFYFGAFVYYSSTYFGKSSYVSDLLDRTVGIR